ncbi:MAG: hypothetical protein HY390_01560 [Deltaproteobacteria bacterium]|nr:hypothetical protein [Deltaproteobacteria bacterium]
MAIKCDLVVYSQYHCEPSTLTPLEIYRTAKQKGMDMVTISDRNTIAGCLEVLHAKPDVGDFFISEELSVFDRQWRIPLLLQLWNISEQHHKELHKLKNNLDECLAYCKEAHILVALPHFLIQFPKAHVPPKFVEKIFRQFSIFEVHHGKNLKDHNLMMAYFLKQFPNISMYGASHAQSKHTLANTYTASDGQTQQDFWNALSQGKTWTQGCHTEFKTHLKEAWDLHWKYPGTIDPHPLKTFSSFTQLDFFKPSTLPIASTFKKLIYLFPFVISESLQFRKKTKQLSQKTREHSLLLGTSLQNPCEL